VRILADYACPRLLYHVSTATPSRRKLENLDSIVRFWIRRWLKLSESTNNHFFYASPKEGGLGIPKFASLVPHMIIGKYMAVLNSTDPVLVALCQVSRIQEKSEWLKHRYKVVGLRTETVKASWREFETKEWMKLRSQGKGVQLMTEFPTSNTWINGESFMTEGEYISALQLRTNTFPTRECLNRGRAGRNVMCRRCGLSVETIGHISGACVEVKECRIARHNRIVHKIKAMAEVKGYRTMLEPRIKVDGRTLIPDLVIYKEGKATVIDPTVVWDEKSEALDLAAKGKMDKYTCLIPSVRQLTGCEDVIIQPLVIGCRGSWHKGNEALRETLSWKDRDVSNLCLLTLCGTLKLLRYFMDK